MKARTIVIGYDGSADARRALDVAMEHAADGGVVHVVTAFDRPSRAHLAELVAGLPEEFQHLDIEATPRGYLRTAERVLEEHGVEHVGHFVDGHPAEAILDVADEVDADLIVVGTRGMGRVERFLRGSVSARIANHARTSLMMVHDDDDNDEDDDEGERHGDADPHAA